MTDQKPEHSYESASRRNDARHERLKLKLRENLKRRKSQAKERGRMAASSDGHQTPPDGGVGKSDA